MTQFWAAIFSRARILFAIEPLGVAPPAAPARRRAGLLRLLLAPEPLPRDPEEPPRSGAGRWLRALFAIERIDPP